MKNVKLLSDKNKNSILNFFSEFLSKCFYNRCKIIYQVWKHKINHIQCISKIFFEILK